MLCSEVNRVILSQCVIEKIRLSKGQNFVLKKSRLHATDFLVIYKIDSIHKVFVHN